ncbi:related to transposase [Sporisorium reilianum f. sp. reilianum]|uniref:Related to transposase n=1 Tax=Sporisorium reilianum f. sp. reilianum TaxID=72559 RepID=A0A2N8UFN3_9BASI|nr:related to transposase [Sporisorium reilianum f. sp. reilianum]
MRQVPGRSQAPEVTHTWLQSFLIRHMAIWTHWSCCLDNACLTGATEDNICQWYNKLSEIMCNFSIASMDIFNMDETSFIFGQAGSERMVVPSGDLASWFKAQPGTQESATIVKCIRSGGQVLLLLIITKGVCHTVGEHRRMNGVPALWCFTKSSNGWTNNKLAVEWLKTIFDPSTRPLTRSQYRLLIIDGHRSHMMDAFCNAAWSRQIILLMLLAHATHIMQLLDVSIFGPLTGSYWRLVAKAAEHVEGINKVQFGTFYTQAQEKVLTQHQARKAFSDCGMTVDPSLEKILRQLADGATTAKHSGTPQQQPLQEITVPCSTLAFNATVDTFSQEPNSRDRWTLKRSIIHAHEEAQASIAVLEAEVAILRAQQESASKTLAKLGRKSAKGDMWVLTKDCIITCEEAERALVEKEALMSRNGGGNHQDEEEEVAAAPPAAAPDDDEGGLTSLTTPSPSPMWPFLDDLDDEQPLDMIDEVDPGGFGFFNSLPQAGPSRTKH